MFEIILGCVIGAVTSLVISEVYYRRTSKDMKIEIDRLKNENDELKKSVGYLENTANDLKDDTEMIRKHTVRGTTDDPEFPYK